MDDDRIYFTCECSQKDHIVVFEIEDWAVDTSPRSPEDIKLHIFPLLNPRRSFFVRLWVALRYVFNITPRYYWNFDSVIIPATELEPLEKMVRRALAAARVREVNAKNGR